MPFELTAAAVALLVQHWTNLVVLAAECWLCWTPPVLSICVACAPPRDSTALPLQYSVAACCVWPALTPQTVAVPRRTCRIVLTGGYSRWLPTTYCLSGRAWP